MGSESIASVTLTCPEAADTNAAVGTYPLAPSDAVPDTSTRLGNYDITYVDGTLLVQASLSVVGPTTGDTVVRGVPTQVTWQTTPAVDSGVFEVWAVGDSGSGDWYDLGGVDAHGGSADYSLDWTPNVPVGDYQICIAYGPDADNWTAVAWPDETFSVVDGITMTTPSLPVSWTVGSTQTVSWTTDWAPTQGEFGVWLIGSNGTWYIGRTAAWDAHDTGGVYSASLPLNVPTGSGYKVAIYYRPTTGSGSWTTSYTSPASITVNGCGAITMTAPTPGSDPAWTVGTSPTVSWTVAAPAPTQGEFCVWLIDSSAPGTSAGTVAWDAHDTDGVYSASLPLNVPTGSGYKVAIYYRPTTGSGSWTTSYTSPASITVNGCGAITMTAPTPGSDPAWTVGTSPTVSWTVASPAPTQGEFCVWLIDSNGTWYIGRTVAWDAHDTGGVYSASLPLNVPTGSGYKVAIYYRPDTGSGAGPRATPRRPASR